LIDEELKYRGVEVGRTCELVKVEGTEVATVEELAV
jgi:hypothetical protein